MKKLFLLIFVFMLHLTLNAEECSCGSYEQGMYDYAVLDGSGGCCGGSQNTNHGSYFTTYVPGPGMTWIVRDVQKVSFSDAVRACCPPA
ncbi:MAG: hypothetical protein Q8K02_01460 [Flavobacterium sp.]|nr:hypothetical protein [Flavobacterium sp.]